MKRYVLSVLAMSVSLLLALAGQAAAIVYGEPDGKTHRYVGALLYEWNPDHAGLDNTCTGTLLSPTIFLTAAHCDPSTDAADDSVWVSFDADVDPVTSSTVLYHGVFIANPDYKAFAGDPHDVAVVRLDSAVAGITPARLPTAGQLDQMNSSGVLQNTQFTAVGYGVQGFVTGGGIPTVAQDGARWRAVSSFTSLTNIWLRLSENSHTGDGGTCVGDSGGPNFIGAGSNETNIIAATTNGGDFFCRATSSNYRLDTPSARAFLGQFVTLP